MKTESFNTPRLEWLVLNKVLIPAALIATVVIAGIFAFMPVEKASTVHGSLASNINEADRAVSFSMNQTWLAAARSTGIVVVPAQTGVTYSGTYAISATANNQTDANTDGAHSAFECGLGDGNGQQVSGTTAAGNATGDGAPASGTLSNLGSGEGIRLAIDTAEFNAATAFGGVCQVVIFLDSDSG